MHTKDKLADAMAAADMPAAMVEKARAGYYHDFLSPLATPELQLLADLAEVGSGAAMGLRERVMDGDFDATAEEADDWANSPEGRDLLKDISR